MVMRLVRYGRLVGWLVWKESLVMGGGMGSIGMLILSYDAIVELDVVIEDS